MIDEEIPLSAHIKQQPSKSDGTERDDLCPANTEHLSSKEMDIHFWRLQFWVMLCSLSPLLTRYSSCGLACPQNEFSKSKGKHENDW